MEDAVNALLSAAVKEESIEVQKREQGIVLFFNSEKGYGFIQPRDGGANLFCHQSTIIMKGYRTLVENQPVEFEVDETSPKGPRAVNVAPQE